jgi:hypothetical protein
VSLVGRRAAIIRIDAVFRLSVRTAAASRLFPLGETLPSTTSAWSRLPLFSRFASTMASTDFSSTYMLGVRLVAPPEPARRTSPGMDETSQVPRKELLPRAQSLRLREVLPMQAIRHGTMLPSLQRKEIGTSELDPFRSSLLGPRFPL